jgi:hypothetical protein
VTLQDLGSLGELAGAIATLLTLAYLAVQIRQNSHQLRESARAAHLASIDQTVQSFSRVRSLLSQADNSELWVKGLASYSALTPAEKVRFRAIIEDYVFAYSALFERVRRDAYDNTAWPAQARAVPALLAERGASEWWEDRKEIFPTEFIAAIEEQRNR